MSFKHTTCAATITKGAETGQKEINKLLRDLRSFDRANTATINTSEAVCNSYYTSNVRPMQPTLENEQFSKARKYKFVLLVMLEQLLVVWDRMIIL